MKAAQLVAPRQFQMVDVPPPHLAEAPPGSVVVKMELASICGSDMPFFAQTLDAYPGPPGGYLHECVGTVVESRSGRFKVGDRILAYPDEFTGFSEFWTTTEDKGVLVDDGKPLEELLMAQPLGTVIWAVRKLPNVIHKTVAVIGQGPMGQLFSHTFSNLGAKYVIGIDLFDYRLEVAKKMRATHTVNARTTDVGEAVLEITKGRGADIVVEAVGHQTETINTAIGLAADRGTVLAFGVNDVERYDINYTDFFRKNLTLVASVMPEVQSDFALSLDWIAQDRVDVRPIITHRLPFTEAQRGFELSMNREDGAIKVVFDFGAA